MGMTRPEIQAKAAAFCAQYRPSKSQQMMIDDGMPPSLARDPNAPLAPHQETKTMSKPANLPALANALNTAFGAVPKKPQTISKDLAKATAAAIGHDPSNPVATAMDILKVKPTAEPAKKAALAKAVKTAIATAPKTGTIPAPKGKAKKAAPAARKAAKAPAAKKAAKPAAKKAKATTPATTKPKAAPAKGGRKEEVTAMMKAPAGTTVAAICKKTGMLPHSARALISGIAKAQKVATTKEPGEATVYRIKAA